MGQFTGLDRVHTESKIHSTTKQTVQSGAGMRVLVPQVYSLTIQQMCAAPAGLWVAYAHWKKQNQTETTPALPIPNITPPQRAPLGALPGLSGWSR